jgi:regulator of sigma D
MPYERTNAKLEDFLTKALRDEEVQDGARRAQLEDAYLEREFRDIGLGEKSPKTWGVATKEIEAYDQLENTYEARLKELSREEQQMRRSYLRIPKWAMVTILVTLSPLLLPLLLVLLRGLANVGLLSSPVTLGSLSGGIGPLQLVIVLLVTIALLLIYIGGCRYLYRRYSASKRQYESRLADIQLELQNNALRERLKIAEQTVEKTVIDNGIIPELRSIVNKHLTSYETSLAISSTRGLAQGFDPDQEITTESKKKIASLLESMPGGSIGIAGPRGSGKSTLLGSFCGKTSTTELEDDPRVVSVFTTAPVQYDAREFILHIFSSVCHSVLEIKGKAERLPWDYMDEMQKPPLTFFSTLMSAREALASLLLGLLLISTLLISDMLSSISRFFSDFFVGVGIFLLMLGVVALLVQVEQLLRQRRQTQLKNQEIQKLIGGDPLVEKAYEWLRETKFQQSFSSGWAGSFRGGITPITAEARKEARVEYTKHQLSLPEIVYHYHEFLKLVVSQEYKVLIGIDEVDKIGSDEKAHNFLNEIKALFGRDSCFYLISVSESAMSSFERRGLPFRDVFDSSFDDIVNADYLDLDAAQRLLRRRVIGVPVPFLDFCHCMAGGLPRDLIRIARDLFNEVKHRNASDNSLAMLCSSLIRSDIKEKLHAVLVATKDVAAKGNSPESEVNEIFDREVNELFGRIRTLETWVASPDRFLNSRPELIQAMSMEVGAKHKEIASLSKDLEVYLYFCVTLLDFFGQEDFSEETLKAAESSGGLEQLAEARQSFATSPYIAALAISGFREHSKLDVTKGDVTKGDVTKLDFSHLEVKG